MRCPIDDHDLVHVLVERNNQSELYLDTCEICHGIWVDSEEMVPLVVFFGADSEKTYQTWLTEVHSGKTAPRDFWHESPRLCPKDGAHLQRHYTGTAHQVGIEQCLTCNGFWFDGGELYAVAKANEPNPVLDSAIGGALRGIQEDLQNNYHSEKVFWWDMYSKPSTALPYIKDLLLNLMIAFIVRK